MQQVFQNIPFDPSQKAYADALFSKDNRILMEMIVRIYIFIHDDKPLRTRILDYNTYFVYPHEGEFTHRQPNQTSDSQPSSDTIFYTLSQLFKMKFVVFVRGDQEPKTFKMSKHDSLNQFWFYCPLLFYKEKYFPLYHSKVVEVTRSN
jgi:hypothetical protein